MVIAFKVPGRVLVEKFTYSILMDSGVARSTTFCGVESTPITDTMFWSFTISENLQSICYTCHISPSTEIYVLSLQNGDRLRQRIIKNKSHYYQKIETTLIDIHFTMENKCALCKIKIMQSVECLFNDINFLQLCSPLLKSYYSENC